MRLRRYAVTVMDNWTPMQTFWTFQGANKFYLEHRTCANVFKWEDGVWNWLCGARDLDPKIFVSPWDAH